jgi:glucose-6-phosphate isomerase
VISLDTSLSRDRIPDDALAAALPSALDRLRTLLARSGPGAGMLGWLDLPGAAARDVDAVRYAALRHLLHESGVGVEVLSTFHPELGSFCEWWKQLAGESEGKGGRGLFPASAVMTTDLHSLGQYLQEGPRNMLETFLSAERPRRDVEIPSDAGNLDELNYLAGGALSAVNRTALRGTREAHAAGGIPVLTVETESLTPASIGALFVFFEIAVSVSGYLLGVNPFDQPGVEEYKKRMFSLLGKGTTP